MKMLRMMLLLGATLSASVALAHPTVTRELLQKFWPDAQSATNKEITPTGAQKQAIAQALGRPLPKEATEADIYIVLGKTGSLGVLVNIDPPGVDMGVAIDRSRQKIVKTVIYKHGGAHRLDAPAFLKQFIGKSAADPFKVGKDIQPVKGMEKQSQIVATDVKAALLLVQKGW